MHLNQPEKALVYYDSMDVASKCESHVLDSMCDYLIRNNEVAKAKKWIEEWLAYHKKESSEEQLKEVLKVAIKYCTMVDDTKFWSKIYETYLTEVDSSDMNMVLEAVQTFGSDSAYLDQWQQYWSRLFKASELGTWQEIFWSSLDPEELELQAPPKRVAAVKYFAMNEAANKGKSDSLNLGLNEANGTSRVITYGTCLFQA